MPKQPTKIIPNSLVSALPPTDRNNAIPYWIGTPTFWCATNLFTFLFMMFCEESALSVRDPSEPVVPRPCELPVVDVKVVQPVVQFRIAQVLV